MTITTDPTVRTPGRWKPRSVAGLPPNGMPAEGPTMAQDER